MPSLRTLNWSAALRDIRSDRAVPNPVREERLRSTAGLRLSAWRGRSGRRYVASIVDVLDPGTEAVVISVRRNPAGIAAIVSVEAIEASEAGAFCRVARLAGATELHIHRLAETAAERAAIVADLR